jgi:ankyrin repeat protein
MGVAPASPGRQKERAVFSIMINYATRYLRIAQYNNAFTRKLSYLAFMNSYAIKFYIGINSIQGDTMALTNWLVVAIILLPQEILAMDIIEASAKGNFDYVKKILEQNPMLVHIQDDRGWTALHAAAANDRTDVIKILISNHAKINTANKQGYTPLHLAISKCFQAAVSLLLTLGADANKSCIYGASPLYNAILNGSELLVKLLLSAGANINQPDNSGLTPLQVATTLNNKGITLILLENGANPNLQTYTARLSCMHLAVQLGLDSLTQLLFTHKGNPNIQDSLGNTPLHEAAIQGHALIAKILITNGALINKRNNAQATPASIANSHGHLALASYLNSCSKRLSIIGTTLALATHTRIGANSPARLLPQELLVTIANIIRPYTAAEQ